MTTGEAVSEVRLNSGFIEFHNLDRQEQLDRKTTTTKPVQKETPRTPSKMARPYLPNPVMLQYHICVRLSLMTFTWRLCFSGCRRKRYSVCDIDWVFWSLKFMCSCICLSGDCKHAVKINLSCSNALALKGDGRWRSHWFTACYAQNTPTGNWAT